MTPRQFIGHAILEALTRGEAAKIAEALILAAKNGDTDAAQMVLDLAGAVPGAATCGHPQGSRKNVTTMGGGPVREVCACGTLLLDGVPQLAEGAEQ